MWKTFGIKTVSMVSKFSLFLLSQCSCRCTRRIKIHKKSVFIAYFSYCSFLVTQWRCRDRANMTSSHRSCLQNFHRVLDWPRWSERMKESGREEDLQRDTTKLTMDTLSEATRDRTSSGQLIVDVTRSRSTWPDTTLVFRHFTWRNTTLALRHLTWRNITLALRHFTWRNTTLALRHLTWRNTTLALRHIISLVQFTQHGNKIGLLCPRCKTTCSPFKLTNENRCTFLYSVSVDQWKSLYIPGCVHTGPELYYFDCMCKHNTIY